MQIFFRLLFMEEDFYFLNKKKNVVKSFWKIYPKNFSILSTYLTQATPETLKEKSARKAS